MGPTRYRLRQPRLCRKCLSGRNRTSDPVIAEIYSHMLYQLSYAEASRQPSAVVQWLGYLAFTQETRVQTPAAE